MLFRIFHRQSGADSIGEDRQYIYDPPTPFKNYERFPAIALPDPQPVNETLSSLLKNRASAARFDPEKSVSLQSLSDLLAAGPKANRARSIPELPFPPRNHPSGGALYPLECYIAARRAEGLSGVYHYDPLRHALSDITEISLGVQSVYNGAEQYLLPETRNPAAIMIITSVWGRNYPKYGEYAYRISLIEAGHLVQNMLLAGTGLGLALRPVGGIAPGMAKALDIENDCEDPLYAALIGHQ